MRAARNLASMTAMETLHIAIFVEERNARLYENYAEMFAEQTDPDGQGAAQAFREMAEEERQHAAQLRALFQARFGSKLCLLSETEIFDAVELPRLEDGNIYAIGRMRPGTVSRVNALRVALAAEEHARRYYQNLADQVADPELATFYAELANFETTHVVRLNQKLRGISILSNSGDRPA